jgi:tripartite-type tricarboxylate transporter receptor subunit TctC
MLETSTQAKMVHVAYKDTNQLFVAASTGEVDFAFGSIATLNSFGGRLRALAVAAPARHAAAPDVPTVAEALGLGSFDISGWTAFAVPRGLPAPVLDGLKRDLDAALADPEVRTRLRGWGWDSLELARPALPPFVAAESAKYGEVIRRSKMSLD